MSRPRTEERWIKAEVRHTNLCRWRRWLSNHRCCAGVVWAQAQRRVARLVEEEEAAAAVPPAPAPPAGPEPEPEPEPAPGRPPPLPSREGRRRTGSLSLVSNAASSTTQPEEPEEEMTPRTVHAPSLTCVWLCTTWPSHAGADRGLQEQRWIVKEAQRRVQLEMVPAPPFLWCRKRNRLELRAARAGQESEGGGS